MQECLKELLENVYAFTQYGLHDRAEDRSEVKGTATAAGEGGAGVFEGAAGEHRPEAAGVCAPQGPPRWRRVHHEQVRCLSCFVACQSVAACTVNPLLGFACINNQES